jgi:hypothetical protein
VEEYWGVRKTRSAFLIGVIIAALTPAAFADSFVNGNFETGDASGWTIGGGYRGNTLNPDLKIPDFLPGGANYDASIASSHSSIVTPGLDANTGNQLNRVYSGNYSWRVEDTTNGGYASVISQSVSNYTDSQIFFAWAAVLEGAHGPTDAATVQILLTDNTAGDNLISREYNAGTTGSGVDARFNYEASTNFYWTPWQIEQLTLPADRQGHDFTLSILAADCQPTGHTGYAYLDGFGSVLPPPSDVPEPASIAMLGAGLGGILLVARRKRAN